MTLKIVKAPQAHFTSRYGHALELSHWTRNPGLIKTLSVLGSSSILFKSLRLPSHQDTVGPRCFCSLIASILPYLASMLISVPFTLWPCDTLTYLLTSSVLPHSHARSSSVRISHTVQVVAVPVRVLRPSLRFRYLSHVTLSILVRELDLKLSLYPPHLLVETLFLC
ncbi:hypothetical protein C8J57DRAFT_363191 [Mycena rebaudengoi]|nr:hypothetical protein C8J57DRAFT_363191 [Mycena rebaudengoi]